jgi:hypothetical protein
MSAGATLQYVTIGCIVIFSGLYTFKHLLPGLWRRGVRALALALEAKASLPILAGWGRRLHAANALGAASASVCASSGACSSCGSCSSTNETAATPVVLADPLPRHTSRTLAG